MKKELLKHILRLLSYILVAAAASFLTLWLLVPRTGMEKLAQLENLITQRFVGEADKTQLEDGAAYGMVSATGDRWSNYIPADQYQNYLQTMNNQYVGIGVTISTAVTEKGIEILRLEENGGAREAGLLAGDYIYMVDGKPVSELGIEEAKKIISGEIGTTVEITVLRSGETHSYTITRKEFSVEVASGEIIGDGIGYVRIENFDERCAQETQAAIESVLQQGAKKLIFDVRNNPGGYKKELVKVLDYLLPEGEIFHTVNYQGKEEITNSDAACLDLPMAVLVNAQSYSAAEFFAAALQEYDKAVVVGEQTVGKGYFQETYKLCDGSAVSLSVGKYYTPKGLNLVETGGLTPDVPVAVEEETAAKIYAQLLQPDEDPQIAAAVAALTE
ncbi:MAG: S41 family peptidase [Oscillospiraceae bacterium]|nr:S41 family peptidase [Oscillospiraceae bacterium]